MGKGVEVGAQELGDLAVLDHEAGDGGLLVGEVLAFAKSFEDLDVGRGAGLGFFDDGELELV